jgi:predicted nucleic acid-binding protein
VLVVDASVAFKWFVTEPDGGAALHLLDSEQLIAPDLIVAEVTDAAWKMFRRGALSVHQIREIPRRLPACFDQIFPAMLLAEDALQVAVALDHPVYDAFYLALAQRSETVLVTADESLFRKTRRTKFAKLVRTLAE